MVNSPGNSKQSKFNSEEPYWKDIQCVIDEKSSKINEKFSKGILNTTVNTPSGKDLDFNSNFKIVKKKVFNSPRAIFGSKSYTTQKFHDKVQDQNDSSDNRLKGESTRLKTEVDEENETSMAKLK